MKIAIVCWPSLGGSGVIAAELATGLVKRGHELHVIATSPPSRALPECDQLHFHEISAASYPLFEHPQYALAVASSIVEVATECALDVVNVHYAVPHAASAYLARQVLGERRPRFVTTLHGTDVTRVGVDPSYQSITRFCVSQSDGIVAPSAFLRDEAHRLLGLPASSPIEVIPNFVDTDRFSPAEKKDRSKLCALFRDSHEDGPMLFHVSNFRGVKRAHELIDVLARVRRSVPARLVLVGDGPERARVAQHARDLGLEKMVCFLGKRSEFVEELRQADVFLLPSESESFGVAALEAMSAGVPVVAYRVGGVPEVISSDAGRLIEPFDLDAFSAAVLGFVSDGALCDRAGRAGRARAVAEYRRDPAIDRYEAYFQRICSEQ